MTEKTIVVNGTVYDEHTGMPLRVERGSDSVRQHAAQAIHAPLQKSRTLHRRYLTKDTPVHAAEPTPQPIRPATATISPRKSAPKPTVSRSSAITRFAKHTPTPTPVKSHIISDFGPAHPLARKVSERSVVPQKPAIKPSSVLKNEAIAQAMAQAQAKRTHQVATRKQPAKFTRGLSMASASLAIILLGSYFTYLSMPAISTRVAAAQAGINAGYPGYNPNGYSLSGPVAYQQGSVAMKFAANAGPQYYTLTQTKSGWDSSAVLDNYVVTKVGKNYTTTTTNGLTIYSYDKGSAWVNGGILYTISGNAPLSAEQVQRIATSL